MKVTLVHTSPHVTHRSWNYLEHLGLGFLEKALHNEGVEVDTIDATWEWEPPEVVVERALGGGAHPALLGLSVSRSNLYSAIAALRLARERGYRGHATLGGYFPTFHFHKVLANFPEVDSIVVGHGEYTLTRLARRLAQGGSPEDVPGLAYRTGPGRVGFEPALDTEGFLETVGIPVHRPRYGVARMITSRGCSWACTFCSVNTFDRYSLTTRHLRRDLDEILEEIDRLAHDGVRHIWLSDMDFIGRDRAFITSLCEGVLARRPGVTFEGDCRIDALDEPLVELLAAAGFRTLFLGVESFARRQLSAYAKFPKQMDDQRVFDVVRLIRAKGMVPRFGFIMFDKDTTLSELELNHEVIAATVGYGTLDSLANKLAVLPGTRLEQTYLADTERCYQVEIGEHNRLDSHLYYTQYRFSDDTVAGVYEASFSYRNKLSRLQSLWDERLRRDEIDYGEHMRGLWSLRDHFVSVYGEILRVARAEGARAVGASLLRDRLDDLVVDYCASAGLDREVVRRVLDVENRAPGPRQP